MLYRFGSLPSIPVFGDEIVINDPAVSLSRGRGLAAPSFSGSSVGIDKLFAHFPPVYIYLQAAVFKLLGVSAYSLRLLTTLCSIAAAGLFTFLVFKLCQWKLATPRTGLLAICLYTLSAPVIILHRMSRMESLIEVFTLVSMLCIFKIVLDPGRRRETDKTTKQLLMAWLLAASFLCGVSVATHPEAVNAVLPVILIPLYSDRIRLRDKLLAIITTVLTPLAIWLMTYGSLWREALFQMAHIAKRKAPEPGFSRFGMDLLGRVSSREHDLMVFFFFGVTTCLMILAFVCAIRAVRARSSGNDCSTSQPELAIHRSIALAVPITLVILVFALPASITRYEVIYPVYLLLLCITPLVNPSWGYVRLPVRAAVMLVILVQFVGCIVYLSRGRYSKDVADRYDPVLDCILPNARIAASPQLWLAFEKRDRSFTILYPGLDGLETWYSSSAQPLHSFDVILLSDYIKQDLDLYAPLSEPGRTERNISVAGRTLHVYSRNEQAMYSTCELSSPPQP